MPHIHLETTADLEENAKIPDILEALTVELSRHETISSKAVKAYHSLRSIWVTGDGAPAGFAHCEVAILTGRSLEIRQRMAVAMMEVMKAEFADSVNSDQVGLTFELREMDAATYQK